MSGIAWTRDGVGRLVVAAGGRQRAAAVACLATACVATLFLVASTRYAAAGTLTGLDPADEEAALDRVAAAQPSVVQVDRPEVSVPVDGVLSWAFVDRVGGALRVSATNHRQTAESMIKAWIAADDLARAQASGATPDTGLITAAIRDSDDRAAELIYLRNGADASIHRLVDACGLTDTTLVSGWWSLTSMSAVDAVRMGECIASDAIAGPQWTEWLLGEMREVRGEGRFGIVDAVDAATAATLAIKNGWTWYGDSWRVNCLAIDAAWVMAVMMTYPGQHGLSYGAQICAAVAAQLLGPKAQRDVVSESVSTDD